jgi:hypothetical protein
VNVLVLVAPASCRRLLNSTRRKAAGGTPTPPKHSAGCSSRFEKRPKTAASTKMSHYRDLRLFGFHADLQYVMWVRGATG